LVLHANNVEINGVVSTIIKLCFCNAKNAHSTASGFSNAIRLS